MSFNDQLHEMEEIGAVTAPLAYGVQFDWGGVWITQHASEVYGLVSPVNTGFTDEYPTFRNVILSEERGAPQAQVLVAGPDEWPGPPEYNRFDHVTALTFLGPQAMHVVVSTGATFVEARIAAELATVGSLPDGVETRTDSLDVVPSDKEAAAAVTECDLQATRRVVAQLAGLAGQFTTAAAPEWFRNRYNEEQWSRLGKWGIVAGGGAVAINWAELLSPEAVPLIGLAAVGLYALGGLALGAKAYRYLRDAQPREVGYHREAIALGFAVKDDMTGLFLPDSDPDDSM